jgi:hypothetical protein
MAQAFSRNKGQAQFAPCIRVQIGDRLCVQADAFALATRQAGFTAEQGEQFVLTIARNPGDTDDLAAAHLQADLAEGAAERVGVVPAEVIHA